MPVTVSHALSATTPDDPSYEIRPSHWNSGHAVTLSATAGTEIFGAFSNDPAFNVAFSTNGGGQVVASANVTAAPSPVNVTGANGSSVNAQTIAFSNSNGMTLGVSTAANGATVTGSYTVPTQTAFVFSNSNGVSFGTNGSTVTATVATNYQSQGAYLTTAAQSNQVVNSVNGSTGAISLNVGSSLSASTNGSSITFGLASNITTALQSAGAYLTTARASNDAIGLNTAQSNVTWTVNSSGISFDARGYGGTATAITGAASITHNSAGLSFNGAALAGTSSGFTGANISATITHNTAGLALSMSVAGAGGAASQTLYAVGNTTVNSSGTMPLSSFVAKAYGVLSIGTSGGSYLFSTPDAVDFTQLSVGNSNLGNTAGDTGVFTGRLVLVGSNNITLSGSSNGGSQTISIIGGAGGGGGVGVGVSTMGNTAGTTGTVTTGNVVFVGSGAISLSQSSSGSNATISINGPATSSLVGGANITVSTAGSTITIIGATAAPSPVNVTGANGSSVNAQTIAFSNANGMTLGVSTAAAGATVTGSYTVPTQSNQSLAIYGSSQTFGQSSSSTYDARSLSIYGSGGVSVGWSNGSLGISGQTTAAQTVQPVAASASNGSFAFSTLAFSNGNGVTFGTSAGSIISASVAAAGGAQTGISGIIASDATYTSGTVSFSNQNGVTIGSSVNGATQYIRLSVANQTAQTQSNVQGIIVSNTTYRTGDVSFSNANGISFGSSAGQAITASYTVPTQTNQTVGVYASSQTTGQSSSSTVDARSLSIVGAGIVSVGLSGGSFIVSATGGGGGVTPAISGSNGSFSFSTVTFGNLNGASFYTSNGSVVASYTVPTQSAQTVGFYASSQTTGQSSSSTVDARSISVVGQGIVSAGMSAGSLLISATQSNQAFSAGAASSTFQTLQFQDTNNVSFSNNAGSIRLNHNLAGTSTGFTGANISGSMTHNSSGLALSLSVAAPGAAAEANAINLLGANTAGNTTATGSTIGWSGVNVTLSGTNNSQVVISAPATSSLVGTNGVSLSTNGSTISISGVPTYTAFTAQNRQLGASSGVVPGQNSIWIAPFRLVAPVSASTGVHMISITGSVTSNQTNTVGFTWEGAIYKVTGTNTTRLDTVFSTTMGFTFWNSGTASVSYSYNVTSSSSAGSNLMTASVYGNRMLTFNIGSTLDPGFYAWAFRQSSSSAGQSSVLRSFNAVMDSPYAQAQGFIGSATNGSIGYVDGGNFSVTSGALPASFGLSQIIQNSNQMPYFKMGAL